MASAEVDFATLAASKGLKEESIKVLVDEDLDNAPAVSTLSSDEIENLGLTMGQKIIIRKWVEDLKGSKGQKSTSPQDPELSDGGQMSSSLVDQKTDHTVSYKTKDNSSFSNKTEQDIIKNLKDMPEDRSRATAEYFKTHGVQGLDTFLSQQLRDHKSDPVHIAITGSTGSGKSSLINAMRGLKTSDAGAAQVGTAGTTMKATPYLLHPDMPNVIIWDLPGFNSTRGDYIEMMKLDKNYDAIIICYSVRVGEEVLIVAKAANEKNIPFYVVRTKLDADIANEREGNVEFDEEKLLKIVRQDVQNNLRQYNLDTDMIFLISARKRDLWDYHKLMDILIKDSPQKNVKAMIMLFESTLENEILLKRQDLFKQMPTVVDNLISKANGETMRCAAKEQVEFYKKQFGLTEDRWETVLPTIKVGMKKIFRIILGIVTFGVFTFLYNFDDEDELREKFNKFFKTVLNKYVETVQKMVHTAIECH